MQELLSDWQLLAYIITTCIGVGITYNVVRTNTERLIRIESEGTRLAQQVARDVTAHERRIAMLEETSRETSSVLARIDERTEHIINHLKR